MLSYTEPRLGLKNADNQFSFQKHTSFLQTGICAQVDNQRFSKTHSGR